MTVLFEPPPPVFVPVRGLTTPFPVHRVYCVGRNYNEHVREMGGEVGRDPPFFFQKPADAIVTDDRFPYPPMSTNVHHEVELVVALGVGARVAGYAVGLDMTRRDLQVEAKKLARPWDTAKGFDFSAPISEIVPRTDYLAKGAITLAVNGQRRQTGDIGDMIWSVREILAELGRYFELKAGDLVFTGTPSGVGPVQRGDHMHAAIAGVAECTVDVV